jgi:hypothetical protein
MKGIAAIGPFIVLLAACGATGGGTATPTSTAVSQASTATPPPDLQAQAAQAYLAAANGFNQAGDGVSATLAALPSAAPWSAIVAPAQGLLTATEAFETAAFAIQFPAEDQADVSALLKGVEVDISDLQAVVADPSDATWTTFTTDNTTVQGDSNAVRHDLGLPPVPTSYFAPKNPAESELG